MPRIQGRTVVAFFVGLMIATIAGGGRRRGEGEPR